MLPDVNTAEELINSCIDHYLAELNKIVRGLEGQHSSSGLYPLQVLTKLPIVYKLGGTSKFQIAPIRVNAKIMMLHLFNISKFEAEVILLRNHRWVYENVDKQLSFEFLSKSVSYYDDENTVPIMSGLTGTLIHSQEVNGFQVIETVYNANILNTIPMDLNSFVVKPTLVCPLTKISKQEYALVNGDTVYLLSSALNVSSNYFTKLENETLEVCAEFVVAPNSRRTHLEQRLLDDYHNMCGKSCIQTSFNAKNNFCSPRETPTSVCSECYCDERCVDLRDCCLDKYMTETLHINQYVRTECKLVPWGYGRIRHIHMITSCDSPHYDPALLQKCERPCSICPLENIPVFTGNSVTFANQYCAECNGVHDYQLFGMRIDCSQYVDLSWYDSVTHIFRSVTSGEINDRCAIRFEFPDNYSGRNCEPENFYTVISTCAVDTSAHMIESCQNFTTQLVNDRDNMKYYRNAFCAICNGVAPFQHRCVQMAQDKVIIPISALLDFRSRPSTAEVKRDGEVCTDTQLFDKLQVCSLKAILAICLNWMIAMHC